MLNIQAVKKEYSILKDAGFKENDAEAIALRSLFRSYSKIISDALDTGHHHFDLAAYDLQMRINNPEAQSALFDGSNAEKCTPNKPTLKYFSILSATGKVLMAAGIAATLVCAMGAPALAQDAPQAQDSRLHFQEKSIDYTLNGKSYPLKVVEVSTAESSALDKVTTVEQALECIKDDKIAAIILAGDFTEKEQEHIREAVSKLYRFNRHLITDLEPVIVKLPNCGESLAAENAFEGASGLKEHLEKYGNGKPAKEVRGYTDYTEVADRILKDITQFIPTDEEDFKQLLKKCKEMKKKERDGDKIERILSGINGDNTMINVIIHEFAHLISYEDRNGYELFISMRTSLFSAEGRYGGSAAYILRRDTEVQKAVEKKRKLLEVIIDNDAIVPKEVMDELGKMMPEWGLKREHEELQQKLTEALKNLGKERLMYFYGQLLEAEIIEWKYAERVAEDIVEVVTDGNAPEIERLKNTKTLEFITTMIENQGRGDVEGVMGEIAEEVKGEFEMVDEFLKEFGK